MSGLPQIQEIMTGKQALDNLLLDRNCKMFKDMDEMEDAVKQELIIWGETPVKAEWGSDGKCTICGEACECPGWHTERE